MRNITERIGGVSFILIGLYMLISAYAQHEEYSWDLLQVGWLIGLSVLCIIMGLVFALRGGREDGA